MDNKIYTNCADCGFRKVDKCGIGLQTETQNNNLIALGVCRFKRSLKWLQNSSNDINKMPPYTLIVCLRDNDIDVVNIVKIGQNDSDCRKIILLDNKDLSVYKKNRFEEYKKIPNKDKVCFTVSTSKEPNIKCVRSNITLINTPLFIVVPPCHDINGLKEFKNHFLHIDDRCVFWEFDNYYGVYLKEPFRFLYQDPSKTFNELLEKLYPYMRSKIHSTEIVYE